MTEAKPTLSVDEMPDGPSGITVLAVGGELDLATIALLKETVGAHLHSGRHIVLDLAGLTFCDSTGLGTFVGLHRQAEAGGARMSLAAPRRRIDDLLQLSGINRVIEIYATPADAAAA